MVVLCDVGLFGKLAGVFLRRTQKWVVVVVVCRKPETSCFVLHHLRTGCCHACVSWGNAAKNSLHHLFTDCRIYALGGPPVQVSESDVTSSKLLSLSEAVSLTPWSLPVATPSGLIIIVHTLPSSLLFLLQHYYICHPCSGCGDQRGLLGPHCPRLPCCTRDPTGGRVWSPPSTTMYI